MALTLVAAAALLGCALLSRALRRARAAADEDRRAYRQQCQLECQRAGQIETELQIQLQNQHFTSMLSHEFRTPLAVIDGVMQGLEMSAGDADDATRKRYRKISRALEQLVALLDEHLSPQRMAEIRRTRQPDRLCPRELLESAVAQHDGSRHKVTLQMDGLPASIRCEPDATRLCLRLLLENAVNHTPPGSHIALLAQAGPQGAIDIVVQDDGPGVAPQDVAQLFDQGYRGAGAQAGSGLGLYIARSVIEAQGGTLTLEKPAQSGAAFRIRLPAGIVAEKFLASSTCNSDNFPLANGSCASSVSGDLALARPR